MTRNAIMGHETLEELQELMSEGSPESKRIVKLLCSIAGRHQMGQQSSQDIVKRSHAYNWGNTQVLYRLDDMNIRGLQIKYACDFCNGDIELLYDYLEGEMVHSETLGKRVLAQGTQRQKDMVEYVNIRTAQDWSSEDDFAPMACISGASFARSGRSNYLTLDRDELEMLPDTQEEFKRKELPKAQVIDYANLDIVSGIPTEKAIKIAEAHGFELIYREAQPDDFGEQVEFIIMEKGAHDILVAPSATKDDFCYGGCSMTGGREQGSIQLDWNSSIQCNYYEDEATGTAIQQFCITYHEGIFNQYSKIPSDGEVPIEVRQIGSTEGIPIPGIKDSYELDRQIEKDVRSGKLDLKFSVVLSDSLFSYNLEHIAGLLRVGEPINKMTPRGREIYQYVYENRFRESLKYYCDASERLNAMDVLFLLKKYTGLTQEMLDEFLEKVTELCKETIASSNNAWHIKSCKKILNNVSKTGSLGVLGSPLGSLEGDFSIEDNQESPASADDNQGSVTKTMNFF